MKKLTFGLAALNLFYLVSCGGSEKKPGEEYYDPDYKPQTSQTSTPAGTGNVPRAANNGTTTNNAETPAANTPDNTTGNTTSKTAGNTAMPPVTEPKSSGDKIKGAPASKNEVVIAAVPQGEVKTSPAGKNFDKGKTLISKSDCLACHKDDAKLVGPAYVDVAKKYPANAKNREHLVNKIINGGAGAWGDIPMSPHPNLSPADAGEMVDYILSLNK